MPTGENPLTPIRREISSRLLKPKADAVEPEFAPKAVERLSLFDK
jgi:hypothetical protein